MKKQTIKKVTIDDLAVMVANGFSEVHKEMREFKDDVGKRLGSVEERLGSVEEGLQSVRGSILEIGDRFVPRFEFDQHLIRFNDLEQKVKAK